MEEAFSRVFDSLMSDVDVVRKRAGTTSILSDGISKYFLYFYVVLMASVRELNCNTVYNSSSSYLVLILHRPLPVTGPYDSPKCFLCHTFNITLSFSVMGHISRPYITTSFNFFLF
jgi:hypothetical protein